MIGTSFNQYRISAKLAEGGMGEVFRGTDTKLGREVAIKVLPKEFASDPDRLRRFEQESKTLAALNHPNILTIHDAGVNEGEPYLVSELLEGRTLREQLSSGALPLRKATDYALQVAQGLAAAHSKGIIHRDLKPENIFITKEGRVKILDFGLAKLRSNLKSQLSDPKSSDNSAAPTLLQTTEAGMVLGTPGYMSPEQVRGEPPDHRSDIFAFGCVLYEMLSGTRAFRRDTPVESMSAVLNEEPPELTAKSPAISPVLERVVLRCLEKQADNRFQSAKDLAFAIENAGASSTAFLKGEASKVAQPRFNLGRVFPWAVAALCLASLLLVVVRQKSPSNMATPSNPDRVLRKFDLTLPSPTREGPTLDPYPAISPDGRKFTYANADGLWIARLDQVEPPVLLVNRQYISAPFWSPQSTEIGYFEDRQLYRVPATGGSPALIGTVLDPDQVTTALGGAWVGDRIIFSSSSAGLSEISALGGSPAQVVPRSPGEQDFHFASALPDGRGVLFVVHHLAGADTIGVWSPGANRKALLQIPGANLKKPVFSPTGHILFYRQGQGHGIWAFPFSLEKLEKTGKEFRVSDGSSPSVANDGTLLFSLVTSDFYARRQLTWVGRSGKVLDSFGRALPGLFQPTLSPDRQSVVAIAGESVTELELWLFHVADSGVIRLTQNQQTDINPHWWNDGRSILFTRRSESGVEVMATSSDGDGVEQPLIEGNGWHLSPSDKYLFVHQGLPGEKAGLGYVRMAEEPRKVVPLPPGLQGIGDVGLSPNDQKLAYESAETDTLEIYLVDFPGFTNRCQVSRGGGRSPRWNPNGRELFYLTVDGRVMMSARLRSDERGTEEPTKIFDLPQAIASEASWPRPYDVSPDGARFLMMQRVQESPAALAAKPSVRVVENWSEEFREKK